jgi:hypothetical protein
MGLWFVWCWAFEGDDGKFWEGQADVIILWFSPGPAARMRPRLLTVDFLSPSFLVKVHRFSHDGENTQQSFELEI